jgi:hypothetical protein
MITNETGAGSSTGSELPEEDFRSIPDSTSLPVGTMCPASLEVYGCPSAHDDGC